MKKYIKKIQLIADNQNNFMTFSTYEEFGITTTVEHAFNYHNTEDQKSLEFQLEKFKNEKIGREKFKIVDVDISYNY